MFWARFEKNRSIIHATLRAHQLPHTDARMETPLLGTACTKAMQGCGVRCTFQALQLTESIQRESATCRLAVPRMAQGRLKQKNA